jgi:hypothetical protein
MARTHAKLEPTYDYLWAEALNLGAYDVLANFFDLTEVTRTLSSALAALAAAVLCFHDVTQTNANGSGGGGPPFAEVFAR